MFLPAFTHLAYICMCNFIYILLGFGYAFGMHAWLPAICQIWHAFCMLLCMHLVCRPACIHLACILHWIHMRFALPLRMHLGCMPACIHFAYILRALCVPPFMHFICMHACMQAFCMHLCIQLACSMWSACLNVYSSLALNKQLTCALRGSLHAFSVQCMHLHILHLFSI